MVSNRRILEILVRKEVKETGKAGKESIRFAVEHGINLNNFLSKLRVDTE